MKLVSYLPFSLTRFSKLSSKNEPNHPTTDNESKSGQWNELDETSSLSQANKSEGIILDHRASDQNEEYEWAPTTSLPRKECEIV